MDDQQNRKDQQEASRQDVTPAQPGDTLTPEQKKPYSKKTRAWAWVGIAFMVFLTMMYFYVFFSGKILLW